MSEHKRIAITGMAINTPLGDELDTYLAALLDGRSAVGHWTSFDSSRIYSKIGADLGTYDIPAKLLRLKEGLSKEMYDRLHRLVARTPWSVKLSLLLAADAWLDSRLPFERATPEATALILAGHNINSHYRHQNEKSFQEEPDFIDALFGIHSWDTAHIGYISELLKIHGSGMLVGAACATGGFALRAAVDEIRHHDASSVVVVGAVPDVSPLEMHAMALIGAISQESFNDNPTKASRPFDARREGFVPSHGGAALILEEMAHAEQRGARIYAELLGVETSMDGSHLPQPSEIGEAKAMRRVLRRCGVDPEQIDYINGHFTSTPLGDVSEVNAIKSVFGDHAYRIKVNATKSMLGHTLSASAVVETIGVVLQIGAGRLHPSINIDELDPAIDLDVCQDGPVDYSVQYCLKNSFGFGGLNASALLARYDREGAQS